VLFALPTIYWLSGDFVYRASVTGSLYRSPLTAPDLSNDPELGKMGPD
jgi:hypothetical protein